MHTIDRRRETVEHTHAQLLLVLIIKFIKSFNLIEGALKGLLKVLILSKEINGQKKNVLRVTLGTPKKYDIKPENCEKENRRKEE